MNTAVQPARRTRLELLFECALLGMLAASFAALWNSEVRDPIILAFGVAALVVRGGRLAGLWRPDLSDRGTTALALLILAAFAADYYLLSREFMRSTLHMLSALSFWVVARARNRRDYFFVKLISFAQLLGACLLAAGAGFLLWLVLYMLFAIVAQCAGEVQANLEATQPVARHSRRGVTRRLAGVAVFLFAGVLLLGVGFFFILPRSASAALHHLVPERFHLPGFSNEVTLGRIGQIRMNPNAPAAFHARFEAGQVDPTIDLKWRGSALSQFDGKRWFNPPGPVDLVRLEEGMAVLANARQRWREGRRLSYQVQLKEITGDVLFFAGIPENIQVERGAGEEPPLQTLVRTAVDGYRTGSGPLRNFRYAVWSNVDNPGVAPAGALAPALTAVQKTFYLQTPQLDPRIPEMARQLSASATTDLAKAAAIERHLKTKFGYSLDLLDQPATDPLAHFLFERKKGHCEYFASAMAVMLRTLGIPSRMATGFQSGTYNPLTGWYLVRSMDAHAWVEAFIPDRGWAIFDPTPPDPALSGATLLSRFRLYADALDVAWQDWVMSYDLERQIFLAERLGRSTRTFSLDWIDRWDSAAGLAKTAAQTWLFPALGAIIAIAALGALAAWLGPGLLRRWRTRERVRKIRQGQGEAADATLLYQEMLTLLGKRGFHKPAWMSPDEFVEALPAGASPKQQIATFTAVYQQLRFGNQPSAAPELVAMLDRLRGGRQG